MTKSANLTTILANQPSFRLKQVHEAMFAVEKNAWHEASNLPGEIVKSLEEQVPFIGVELSKMIESEDKSTYKALLRLADGEEIEAVLMKNARDAWTLCVSSQVGCAMKCGFCATGMLGLARNLDRYEIVDQYRFFQRFLHEHADLEGRISNIVYMGMGEPMANYEEVKASLKIILDNTDIGPTRITVSSVGILPRLEQILDDTEWPDVRLAISLHSADDEKRRSFMPSSTPDFLLKLADWSKRYLAKFGNRRHYLTFEYILLAGLNDGAADAQKLAKYVKQIGDVRINLIPYNTTLAEFTTSSQKNTDRFKKILEDQGITVTIRKSQGQDIAAACGQLARARH